MPEQIIYHGYTTQSDWQDLDQRSRETRHRIQPLCPACNAEIHHTQTTGLRCIGCHAPVEVYQHRELTETADTRIIYAQANGQHRALVTLDLQCLSCERRLQADETCTNTCGIQTYLVSEHDDGELYIRRAANLPDVPRDTPFIPIRTQPDTDTPETENSVYNSVYNSVQKEVSHHDDRDRTTSCSVSENSVEIADANPPNPPLTQENEGPWQSDALTVPEKIVEFLTYINAEHTATGTDIKAALGGLAPSTFKWAIDELISDGKAEKVAYNLYRLRT